MNIFKIGFILSNISNINKLKLINKYGTEEEIYNNIDSIVKDEFRKNKLLSRLEEINHKENKKFVDYINKEKIGYITIDSPQYPEDLKNIVEPPYVLFYKGDLSLLSTRKVAIVGARNCTTYGSEVTKIIARELCNNEIAVVSGVASGIDSIAHKVVLEEHRKTIGVLGCGIDVIYPKSNYKLYDQIIKDGLLLSEFLPGTKPLAYNFPRRNRIISGLSEGVVVVEASLKSGSLITANYAIEQGKDVIVVPGSVLNKSSLGCNKLIRDGAHVFTEIEDMNLLFKITKKDKNRKVEDLLEKKLLSVVSKEPRHLDDIVNRVNVDRKVLFGLLFEMQKRNEIICLPGNYYAKLT